MPDTTKRVKIPPTDAQLSGLKELLDHVPSHKVVHYDWTSGSGRAFIKKVRELQIAGGVPLPWIAEALEGVTPASLAGAVGYWERSSATRGSNASRRKRDTRPLRKGIEAGE